MIHYTEIPLHVNILGTTEPPRNDSLSRKTRSCIENDVKQQRRRSNLSFIARKLRLKEEVVREQELRRATFVQQGQTALAEEAFLRRCEAQEGVRILTAEKVVIERAIKRTMRITLATPHTDPTLSKSQKKRQRRNAAKKTLSQRESSHKKRDEKNEAVAEESVTWAPKGPSFKEDPSGDIEMLEPE